MKTALRVLAVAALPALFAPAAARADILLFKNGEVVECRILGSEVRKTPGQGGPKEYLKIQLEDGSKKEYLVKDVAQVIKRKPSWEVRKENKDWYAKTAPTIAETWQAQEKFGLDCRRKKYLDDEVVVHLKKAWDLRKSEIKPEIDAHSNMAKMLESKYGLFEEAKDEWRWVYAKKKEGVDTASQHVTLAKWCTTEGLYDEALVEYSTALEKEPANSTARSGLEKLRKALEVPVDAQLYRIVKEPLTKAVNFLKASQNKDGSFGSDITEAGHHGTSSLAGLSLIALWEFQTLEDLEKAKEPPKELVALLNWTLSYKEKGKNLRGPDVWGPIFRLEFLAKCYKKYAFDSKKEAIKARAVETLQELQACDCDDGGWAYYDFVKQGITFVTASGIVSMVEAKNAGLPFDADMIGKAAETVKKVKQGPGAYSYRPGVQEAPVGCAGRSSLCELALMMAGQNQGGLGTAVDNFLKYRHLLEAIKGQAGTHIGEGKTAPYYYLFGHYWTARAIKKLPKSAQRTYLKKICDEILLDQQSQGEFWDWPLHKDHKVCGTALGALCLYQIALEDSK
jgi:hypothetical protein